MSNSIVSQKIMHSALVAWIPFAVTIILLSSLAYVIVQQNYRQSANDPQVQIAEDLVVASTQGQDPASLVPPQGITELGISLSPFLIVANATGTVVGSSVIVDGKNPVISESILAYAKLKGENRLTWQPKAGVRAALVIKPYKADTAEGFVIVGRSLREVEARITQEGKMVGLGALITLLLSFAAVLYLTNATHKISHVEKITEIEIKS